MGGMIDNYGQIVSSSVSSRAATKSDVINIARQYAEDAGFNDVYMIRFSKNHNNFKVRFYSKLKDITVLVILSMNNLELTGTKTANGELKTGWIM